MPLVAASKKLKRFDPKTFLSTIDGGRKIEAFPKKQTIFAQGDPCDAVFYIREGKVKLAVVSKSGKEATIGILNEGDFFGEGCLSRLTSTQHALKLPISESALVTPTLDPKQRGHAFPCSPR